MLLFFVGNIFVAAGQTSIGDVINRYAKVVSISENSVQVATNNQAALFSRGDTILLIQMKGVVLNSSDLDYGGIYSQPNGAIGLHEFLIIESISGTQITFMSPLVHYGNAQQYDNFNPDAFVQIIRTPSYPSAIVTGKIEATPWDSINGYGGVVSFFAGKSLELRNNIDVSGQGFAGAPAVASVGVAITTTNSAAFDGFSYGNHGLPSDTSGLKGEGIGYLLHINGSNKPISPNYSKGKAPNYSGGGGGNGAFSGGGGGSNGGAGGIGAQEKVFGYPYSGGVGGKTIPSNLQSSLPSSNVRLYLGGGGGGSTFRGQGHGVNAGNGGGIIIIVCDSIIGNGHRIMSNGATPSDVASGEGGAGGGGAGGSIAIYTSAFADSR
ncbi:MAG: hypothetical protein J6X92_01245, partial [Bacteroidales bacterium]|nr:hypothetical protein [Bacteroidales bacterium]